MHRFLLKKMGYHFCKDCVYGDTIVKEEIKIRNRDFIKWHCAVSNYGHMPWSPSDFGKIKHDCAKFEQYQTNFPEVMPE